MVSVAGVMRLTASWFVQPVRNAYRPTKPRLRDLIAVDKSAFRPYHGELGNQNDVYSPTNHLSHVDCISHR